MTIDVESLREDMMDECYGAFFCGGIGEALIESVEIEKAPPEELVKLAKRQGINLNKYKID